MAVPKQQRCGSDFRCFRARHRWILTAAWLATFGVGIAGAAQQELTQESNDPNNESMKAFEAVLKLDRSNAQARAGEVKAATAAALPAQRAGDNDGPMAHLVPARKFGPDDP